MALSINEEATEASTALSGSSNKYKSALEYKARAKAIRARCPPLILIPRYPTVVSLPSANCA